MKKKSATRPAKASSRQSTLNVPTSSEADLVAESAAVETSKKSGAKKRREGTADFADDTDKNTKSHRDSSAISAQSAVKNSGTVTDLLPAVSREPNQEGQGKNRSAALGRHPSNTRSSERAVQQSAITLLEDLLAKRESGFRGRGKYHPPALPDLTGIPAPPSGWIWASPEQLSNAAPYSLGIGPFGSNLKVSDYREGGTPLIFVRNIRAEDFGLVAKFVSEQKANELAAHTAEGGDILITKMGEPPGHAAYYPIGAPRAVITADCIKWRLAEELRVPKFFVYAIRSRCVQQQIQSRTRGVAQKKISLERFRDLAIPLPPLPEQHRIVAEIEKQFTRLDAGVAALKRVQANLKRYRAAVLKAACEGRLVPTEAELRKDEGRRQKDETRPAKPADSNSSFIPHPSSFESSEALLARILTERRQNWQGRGQYKEPAAPNALAYESNTLPEGWTWASLDQLLQNITDGDHLPPPQTDSGIPLLVIGNIRTGKLSFKDTRFVARDYYDAIDPYRRPRWGDILYSLVGSYGIGLRVDTENEFCIQRHIGVMRPHGLSPSDYLVHVLNSRFVFKQATAAATGTAQKTVSLAGLRQFAIPLPPMAEQTRIVAEVERRLSVVEELEAVVSANLQRAVRLRQSILQKAFTGQLV